MKFQCGPGCNKQNAQLKPEWQELLTSYQIHWTALLALAPPPEGLCSRDDLLHVQRNCWRARVGRRLRWGQLSF